MSSGVEGIEMSFVWGGGRGWEGVELKSDAIPRPQCGGYVSRAAGIEADVVVG